MDKSERNQLYVDLKEHFEALWAERKANIEYQFKANNDRLNATAEVLEQRLEILNHAHEKAIKDRTDFISSVEYRNKMIELAEWREGVNKKITALETRSITWTAAVGIIFVLIQTVLYFLK